MPKVTILPHPGICPNGAEFEVPEGANLAKALVANGVNIDHACEFSCACTTCHLKFRNTPVITPERTSNEADLEGSACDCGRAV